MGCGLALVAGTLRADLEAEVDLIAELLRVEPGQVLADVGAGEGDFATRLAGKVGETGLVIATEVDPELVEAIERAARDEELPQLLAVLGDQDEIGLDAGCCDAILLRLVYHHFQKPEAMRADLRRALKPGGVLAVIDIKPQENWRVLPGVPDRGGHGIGTGDLIQEMLAADFLLVEERSDWNGDEDRYALVFRRPLDPRGAAD